MRKLVYLSIALVVFTTSFNLLAISPAESSRNDYVYTLTIIRELRIVTENFGTDEQKKKFAEMRVKFQKASERHYARDFIKAGSLSEEDVPAENSQQTSNELFYDLKLELIAFLKDLSGGYIIRSKEMLDLIATDATNVIIEYGRNSGLWKYFFRPIDPLVEKKPYNAKTFYYFFKRQKIEANLRDGYKYLQDARNRTMTPDYVYVVDKQKKTHREINFIIDSYMGIIKDCRQAKKCGLDIYHVLNEKDLNEIMKKYSISMGMITKYPVYDDRVPEKYKADAVDVEKMLLSIEKARVANYDDLNKERSAADPAKKEEAKGAN